MVAIKQHLQADREKLTKIRALLVNFGGKKIKYSSCN